MQVLRPVCGELVLLLVLGDIIVAVWSVEACGWGTGEGHTQTRTATGQLYDVCLRLDASGASRRFVAFNAWIRSCSRNFALPARSTWSAARDATEPGRLLRCRWRRTWSRRPALGGPGCCNFAFSTTRAP
eukprot:3909452-Prymnesium_polylepis.3